MADTLVETTMIGTQDSLNSPRGPYWATPLIGAIVFVGSGVTTLQIARTTDGGATWVSSSINSCTVRQMAVWYDQETPGITTFKLHITWVDGADDEFQYIQYDVFTGLAGSEVTVQSGVTVDDSNAFNRVAITKTRSGNLLAAYSTQTEIECLRSTDDGDTWTDRADPFETATEEDWLLLVPANTGDDDDACGIFGDRSANELSLKMYDESANSWTETAIGTMVDSATYIGYDAAVRHSDGHVLLAFVNWLLHSTNDLQTYDLTLDSIASPTITAKTNVWTNVDESWQPCVFINQRNDDVYVCYIKAATAWNVDGVVYYQKSTDDMGTWDGEVTYQEDAADDVRVVAAGRTVGDYGGRFMPCYYNDDLVDIYVNETNDIRIEASKVILEGDQPAASGALSVQYQISLTGNQPAASGTLGVKRPVKFLAGNQPAATGTIGLLYQITLAGAQPEPTGALSVLYLIALAGAQPAASGALTPLFAVKQVAGVQPAPSGALHIGGYLLGATLKTLVQGTATIKTTIQGTVTIKEGPS